MFHAAHAAAEARPNDGRFIADAVFYRDALHMGVQLSENLNSSLGISLERAIGYCHIAAGSVFVWLNVNAILRICSACVIKLAVADRNIRCICNRQIISSVVMQIAVCDRYTVARWVAKLRIIILTEINTVAPALRNFYIFDVNVCAA